MSAPPPVPGPYAPYGGPYPPRRRGRIWWIPLILLGVLTAFVVGLFALVVTGVLGHGLGGADRYYLGPLGLFGLFFLLLVAFFLVRVTWWMTRWGAHPHGPMGGGGGARRVARMRYARGEITREEFQQIMRDLGERPGDGRAPPPS